MTTDPDQIREQIEDTRTGLSQDVSVLADTVNPAQAARRSVTRVRSAVARARGKVMGTASQSVPDSGSAVAGTASAAQHQLSRQTTGNPLAAGLIALGAGWLAGSLWPASSAEEQAAARVKEAATPAVTAAAKQTAASLQGSAQHAAESVRDAAADAVSEVKNETVSSAGEVRDQALEARDTVTEGRQ